VTNAAKTMAARWGCRPANGGENQGKSERGRVTLVEMLWWTVVPQKA